MTSRFAGVVTACILAASSVSVAEQTATQSFDSNGVQISYLDKGRGAPDVLLHGLTGSAARHWEGPGVITALETAGDGPYEPARIPLREAGSELARRRRHRRTEHDEQRGNRGDERGALRAPRSRSAGG